MAFKRPARPERPRRSLVGAPVPVHLTLSEDGVARPTGQFPELRINGEGLARAAAQADPEAVARAVEQESRASANSHRSFPKTKMARSAAYLAFVRAEPCCVCSAPAPSDPHHFGPRGVGQKTDDFRTVPLCRRCHDDFHACGLVPRDQTRAATEHRFYSVQVTLLVRWASKER